MRAPLSGTLSSTRPPRGARMGFRLRIGRHGGPSPAESLIPQMQERERRKHYQDRALSAQAPTKLIGYVSAGSFEWPGAAPAPQRKPHGRAVVVAIAVAMAALWLGFSGA